MLTNGRLPRSEYGGPLFVLGAVKTNDAQQQGVLERRRIEYLIASRYLTEARAYGYPQGREAVGDFLLGQSLVESGQFGDGTQVLKELVGNPTTNDGVRFKSQQLLAETCLRMPHPKLDEALSYNDAVIANPKTTQEEHAGALIQRAECLSRLERFDEARQSIQQIPATPSSAAAVAMMLGRISLDQVDAVLQKVAASDRSQSAAEMAGQIDAALSNLKQANALDEQKARTAAQSSYELGRGLALKGDYDGASETIRPRSSTLRRFLRRPGRLARRSQCAPAKRRHRRCTARLSARVSNPSRPFRSIAAMCYRWKKFGITLWPRTTTCCTRTLQRRAYAARSLLAIVQSHRATGTSR